MSMAPVMAMTAPLRAASAFAKAAAMREGILGHGVGHIGVPALCGAAAGIDGLDLGDVAR
jgi:hypothetical protein